MVFLPHSFLGSGNPPSACAAACPCAACKVCAWLHAAGCRGRGAVVPWGCHNGALGAAWVQPAPVIPPFSALPPFPRSPSPGITGSKEEPLGCCMASQGNQGGKMLPAQQKRILRVENPPFLMGSRRCDPSPDGFWAQASPIHLGFHISCCIPAFGDDHRLALGEELSGSLGLPSAGLWAKAMGQVPQHQQGLHQALPTTSAISACSSLSAKSSSCPASSPPLTTPPILPPR